MKIKRRDLHRLSDFKDYIFECNPLIFTVYSSSIYFTEGVHNFISWEEEIVDGKKLTSSHEDMLLRTINALCNTAFEFID